MLKNKKSLVIILAVVLIGVIGGTVAYFTSAAQLNNIFTAGIYQTSVREEFISPDNWTPGTTTPKIVDVTNNGNVEVAVRATYSELWTSVDGTILTGVRHDEKVALVDIGEDWIKGEDGYYYYNQTLGSGEISTPFITSVTYNPNFELVEGVDKQCIENKEEGKTTISCSNLESGYAGATYVMDITIETIQADRAWNYEEQTLYNVIAKQATIDNGINLLAPSNATNTTGVYTATYTKDEAYPVHYFRGNVDNNNVLFGGYCWHIVRTTETGGVKLVYNGEPTVDGKCMAEGEDRQIGVVGHNWKSLAYAGYMYNTVYKFDYKSLTELDGIIAYGNSFEYENGKYTLKDSVSYSTWEEAYQNLSNHHYTCFNDTGVCEDVIAYINYTDSDSVNYVNLKGGKTIDVALAEMLWADDVNEKDSILKSTVDNWYEDNMTNYTQYLEDTVWCSDRSYYTMGGFNPNNTTLGDNAYVYFGSFKRYVTNSLNFECPNLMDSFTVDASNGNGNLIYPVGTLTAEEALYAGGGFRFANNYYYLNTGSGYWLMSPGMADDNFAALVTVVANGSVGEEYDVSDEFGVRPSISLKPGIDFIAGDGTTNSPYIIETQ